jgi:hypothetical protein
MSIRTALSSIIAWNASLFAPVRAAAPAAPAAPNIDDLVSKFPSQYRDLIKGLVALLPQAKTAPAPTLAPAAPATPGIPAVAFIVPTQSHSDYPSGRAVLKLFGHGLRADLTLGASVSDSQLSGNFRPATANEITTIVSGWASAVGIDTTRDNSIEHALDRWVAYSVGTPTSSAAGAPSDVKVLVDQLTAQLPGGLGTLVATLVAALPIEARIATAAPATSTPSIKPFSVVVPTQSSGVFRAGEPIFVIARGPQGWLVLTRSGHSFAPAGHERYIRAATAEETRTALNYLVGQVRAKIAA